MWMPGYQLGKKLQQLEGEIELSQSITFGQKPGLYSYNSIGVIN